MLFLIRLESLLVLTRYKIWTHRGFRTRAFFIPPWPFLLILDELGLGSSAPRPRGKPCQVSSGPPSPFLLCSSGMSAKCLLQNRGSMSCRGISLPPWSFLHNLARILRVPVASCCPAQRGQKWTNWRFDFPLRVFITNRIVCDLQWPSVHPPPFLATGSLSIP